MKRKQFLLTMVSVIAMLCTLIAACGDDDDDDSSGDDDVDNDDDIDDDTAPPPPPDEAIDACEGMELGDDCEFEGMGSEAVVGTCEQIGEFLACAPEGGPPPM